MGPLPCISVLWSSWVCQLSFLCTSAVLYWPAPPTFLVWWCWLAGFKLWVGFGHQLFILLSPAAAHLCISSTCKETLAFYSALLEGELLMPWWHSTLMFPTVHSPPWVHRCLLKGVGVAGWRYIQGQTHCHCHCHSDITADSNIGCLAPLLLMGDLIPFLWLGYLSHWVCIAISQLQV